MYKTFEFYASIYIHLRVDGIWVHFILAIFLIVIRFY